MPVSSLPNAFSVLASVARRAQPNPFKMLIRTTKRGLRPGRPLPFRPRVTRSTEQVLLSGVAERIQLAPLFFEPRPGDHPTIVLGGFVPESTEQVYLARKQLLRHGSVYYLNYPRLAFSLDLLCAQLDDLVEELALRSDAKP